MTDMPWETISSVRLRNVWISGHIDALQEVAKILDGTNSVDQVREQVYSKLILAQDTQRRLRERS